MSKSSKNIKKHLAFNSHYIAFIPGMIIFLILGILCTIERDVWLAIAFYVVALFSAFCICVSPIYYIFTEKSVTIIYCFGISETINWSDIRSISKWGSWWFSRHLPFYQLSFPQIKKRPFFVNGEISYSKRTKKYIKKFYIKNVENYS